MELRGSSVAISLLCIANIIQAGNSTSCAVQISESLALNKLVEDVLDRNPDLAAAQSRIRAAAQRIPRAQALDDPQFTFRSMGNSIGPERDFIKERRYKFSQVIPFPGKLRLRGVVAKHVYNFFIHEEMTTARELVLQTKKLYFQLFLNRTDRDINKQNRDITKRLINGALAVYKSGTGSQADVFKGEIELQLLDDELLSLQAEQETLAALINVLLDQPQTKPIEEPQVIFQSTIPLDYGQLEAIAMQHRSELHGLEEKVEEEEAKARLAKQEYFPDFTFMFMMQNKPSRDKNAWGVNFGFNIPIFINQKQRRDKEEAEANASANQFSFYWMQAQIRGRIKELIAKIHAAEERITLYKTGLMPKAAETLASYEQQYRVGKLDFLTVLDSRRQLQSIELDYEQARIEREVLFAELERALGIPLDRISHTAPVIQKNPKIITHKEIHSRPIRTCHKKIKQKRCRKRKSRKTKSCKERP